MIDLQQPLEQAIFTRLDVLVTLCPVYQHPPENTPPPVVIMTDFNEEEIGGKDSPFSRFDFTIATIVQGAQRATVNAIQAEVRSALDDWTPAPASGVIFGDIRQTGRDAQLLPDGLHYYGSQRFTCFVQPA